MFTGSLTALVTPFVNGAVDKAALKGLVDWQIAEGSNGIVAVGTTGETPTLTHDEHREVVRIVVETAAGRVPVIAAPQPRPTKPRSQIGVSRKRSAPYFANSPAVVPKFPPRTPMPSPSTKMPGLRAIS